MINYWEIVDQLVALLNVDEEGIVPAVCGLMQSAQATRKVHARWALRNDAYCRVGLKDPLLAERYEDVTCKSCLRAMKEIPERFTNYD